MRNLAGLLPLLTFALLFFSVLACVLIVDDKESIFNNEISRYGEYPGAQYIIFSIGFTLASFSFFLTAYARHKLLFHPFCNSNVKKFISYLCLFLAFLQIPTTIIMAFSNGLRSGVHRVFAVLSWAFIAVYVIESALLLIWITFFNLTWFLFSFTNILLASASIVLLSIWNSADMELLEWLGVFFILAVLIVYSFELFYEAMED